MDGNLATFKWNENSQEFEACDPDDSEAEWFEWCEEAFEWVHCGEDE